MLEHLKCTCSFAGTSMTGLTLRPHSYPAFSVCMNEYIHINMFACRYVYYNVCIYICMWIHVDMHVVGIHQRAEKNNALKRPTSSWWSRSVTFLPADLVFLLSFPQHLKRLSYLYLGPWSSLSRVCFPASYCFEGIEKDRYFREKTEKAQVSGCFFPVSGRRISQLRGKRTTPWKTWLKSPARRTPSKPSPVGPVGWSTQGGTIWWNGPGWSDPIFEGHWQIEWFWGFQ